MVECRLNFLRKHDADGAGAGVAADGRADVGLNDVLKLTVFAQTGFDGLHAAGFGLAGRDKDHAVVDVVPAIQQVGDVLAHADGQAAAILPDDLQLTVDDGEAGLDAQNVGAERQHAGAATALGHVVELVEHKAQLDPVGEVLEAHTDVPGRQAVRSPLGGTKDKIALTGADVLAVDDRDVVVFLCGKAGVLIAGGKLGTDRDVDDGVVLLGKGLEEVDVLHGVCGSGFRGLAACIHMGKNVSRMNGDAVQISIVAHQDVHGHQRNVPLPQQLFGQITGAVGGDLDVQKVSPLFVPGAADVGAGAAAAKFPL